MSVVSDNELLEIMANRLGLKIRVSKSGSIDVDDGDYWVSLRNIELRKLIQLLDKSTPTLTLPKAHQFYTTYSRAGYYREDVIRALNDAGIKHREQE